MKISFSYNEIAKIQIATVRRQEAYDLVRSYLGIPVGVRFDDFDLIDSLTGDTFTKYFHDDDTAEYISIRGVEIDLTICLHAIRTLISLQNIQVSLNAFANKQCSLSAVSRTVKHAKDMIESVEW